MPDSPPIFVNLRFENSKPNWEGAPFDFGVPENASLVIPAEAGIQNALISE